VTRLRAPAWDALRAWLSPAGLALLSGALYFAAFPPIGAWPLALVALIPLLVAIHRRTPSSALLLGLMAGTTTAVAGFAWLMPMLLRYSGFPAPICAAILLLLGIWQGGRMALSAWLFARAERNGWGLGLAWPLALVAGEALYPLLFPWYFGCALVPATLLAQLSDLGGPMLLSVVLGSTNATIALWMVRRSPRPWGPTVACCALLIASLTYGWLRVRRVDGLVASAPATTVGLVQGNIPMDIQGQTAYRDAFQRQAAASRDLIAKGASWIVWSESAFLYPVPEETAERFLLDGLTRSLGRPAILGALVYRDGAQGERTYNSALVTDAAGRLQGRYDKHHLLAFGEYLPLGETFPVLHKWSPASGRITPGSGFQPLSVDNHPIAILICYEDILPGFVLDAVRATSPEMLVDITNDAWFGETSEPALHLALARLRAIEHRTFLVRAANTGVTSVVDPVGRVVASAREFEPASLMAEARWFKLPTVYESVGNLPWFFAAGAAIALAWLPRSRLRRGNAVSAATRRGRDSSNPH